MTKDEISRNVHIYVASSLTELAKTDPMGVGVPASTLLGFELGIKLALRDSDLASKVMEWKEREMERIGVPIDVLVMGRENVDDWVTDVITQWDMATA